MIDRCAPSIDRENGPSLIFFSVVNFKRHNPNYNFSKPNPSRRCKLLTDPPMHLFGLLNVIFPAIPLAEFGYAHIPVQVGKQWREKLGLGDEEFLITQPP